MEFKPPHEMLFVEFAEAVRPSAGINRFPQLGAADEVVTYTAYLNGPVASAMPAELQEETYQDVLVEALTARLGLNPDSSRDNMRVAELAAVRGLWMSAVLEAATNVRDGKPALSEAVVADYEKLSDGFSHPWLQEQIAAQKMRGQAVTQAVSQAERTIGAALVEISPAEVNKGVIVARNLDFTVQHVGGVEVVPHENRRLDQLPALGDDVTVAYSRGQGMVFSNPRDISVSVPFIDHRTGQLAIVVEEAGAGQEKTVSFSGVAAFSKFVEALNLPRGLVEDALTLQMERQRAAKETGAQKGEQAGELSQDFISKIAVTIGKLVVTPENGRQYSGSVLYADEQVVVQNLGMSAVVYPANRLDQSPTAGEFAKVKWSGGRGEVDLGKDRGGERER